MSELIRRSGSKETTKGLGEGETSAKEMSTPTNLLYILPISLAMGICFGFALEKGRVFEPLVIVDQMLFRRFQMVKMFLSAVATSTSVMALLFGVKSTAAYFHYSRTFIFRYSPGWLAVGSGAFLLGAGMAVAGACPGTVVVQLGAGVSQAIPAIAGGLLAGLIHSYFYPVFRKIEAISCPEPSQRTADRLFGIPYTRLALPLIVSLGLFVAGLEYIFPWRSELGNVAASEAGSVLSMKAWPPEIAGFIVGLLNLPAILALTVSIGSAASFSIIPVNILKFFAPKLVKTTDYLAKFTAPIAYWQPTYLLGAVIGAFISSSLSGSFSQATSLSPTWGFLGGLLLILGSRLAGGCTSGHGISGFAYLQSISFVAVPVMFAGGISTAFLLNALGLYPAH